MPAKWYLHSSSIGDMPSCDPIGYCNQPVASLVRFMMNCTVSLLSCDFSSKGNEIGIVLFHIYASFLFKSRRAVSFAKHAGREDQVKLFT